MHSYQSKLCKSEVHYRAIRHLETTGERAGELKMIRLLYSEVLTESLWLFTFENRGFEI